MKINRYRLLFLFTLIISVLFFSCEKYPDGPVISLKTKMHRLAGLDYKRWDVEYFSIDNYDSTDYLKSQPLYGKYTFSKKGKDQRSHYSYTSYNNLYGVGGYWEFKDNKEEILIYRDMLPPQNTDFNLGPYNTISQIWEIQRLTEKELWLKCTYHEKKYFVKFKN
jgi:hypothetical protein